MSQKEMGIGCGKSDYAVLPLIRVMTGEGKGVAEKRSANGDNGTKHSVGQPGGTQ